MRQGDGRKRGGLPILLYPLVIPVTVLWTAWAEGGIHVDQLVRPLLAVIVGSAVLIAALSLLSRSRHVGGAAAAFLLLAAVIPDTRAAIVLLGVSAGVTLAGALGFGRWPVWGHITSAMHIFAPVLLVVVLVSTLPRAVPPITGDIASGPRIGPASGSAGPDIFIVLLDGYPGARASRIAPFFDARSFPRALEARGFDVVPDSASNYLTTSQTLASMFTMRHLTAAEAAVPRRLRALMDEGRAIRSMAAAGYETIAVSGGYSPVDVHAVAQRISPPQLTEFEVALLRATFAGRVVAAAGPDLLSAQHRDRIEATFQALESISRERQDRPRLVFVHVPAPHGPWVFGPGGEPREQGLNTFYSDWPPHHRISRDEAVRRSFDQSSYVAQRTIEAIDRVIAGSASLPVIVVFSDHGPGVDWDLDDPAGEGVATRASNFMAALTPGRHGLINEAKTPVNLFPALLNGYFDAAVPSNSDRTYVLAGETPELIEMRSP